MNCNLVLLLPIILPILAGLIVFFVKPLKNRKARNWFIGSFLIINGLITFALVSGPDIRLELFYLTKEIPVLFKLDSVGRIYTSLLAIMWTLSAFFAFEYMKHEGSENRYFGFFLVALGALNGVAYAGNLVTFYMCYETMTLVTMPMVLHSLNKEAVKAGLKYLFYSICGASFGLLGIFYMNQYTSTIEFMGGGTLDFAKLAGHEGFFLVIVFLSIVGFGAKAGMFPLHGWLPTAHPVAPAPASAILSGVIVKAGVVGIIRVIFFIVGPDFLRGTWVQTAWMSLALLTVFMGSMLAYKEQVLKKRLAYSTVSQVSYILFGLSLLNADGALGGMQHIVFHSFIKNALFLAAGAIIYKTGKTKVSELRGIGKEMPITMWSYTIVSLGLIGIPPTCGFISKWNLAVGSLQSGISFFSWLGPIVLLVSALLTAGYLLPVSINGFFPGADFDYASLKKKEPNKFMTIPLMILAAGSVLLGMFPNGFSQFIQTIIATIF